MAAGAPPQRPESWPPPGQATLDYSHPLLRDLRVAWLGREPYRTPLPLLAGFPNAGAWTMYQTYNWRWSPWGPAFQPTSDGSEIYSDNVILPTTAWTCAMLVNSPDAGAWTTVGGRVNNTGTSVVQFYIPFSDGVLYADWGGNLSPNRVQWTPPASWFGAWHQLVWTIGPAGACIYSDGVLKASTSGSVSRVLGSSAGFDVPARNGGTNPIWAQLLLYNRTWTPADVAVHYTNPWAMFRRVSIGVHPDFLVSTAAPQFARPTSDISAGGWTPSTGADLYAMLDETVADDADYIQSATTPTNDTAELALSSVTDPAVSTGHIIRIRARKPS